MPAHNVGVSTVIFDHLPIAEAIRALAGQGVRIIEPAYIHGFSPFDEVSDLTVPVARVLRHVAEASGAMIETVSLHFDLGRPDAIAALRTRIAFAAELGAKIIITNAGSISKLDRVREVIETSVPELERNGLTLGLENPGHGSDAITGSAGGLGALVRGFASPQVRANLDFCNAYTYSGGSEEAMTALGSLADIAVALHLKDIVEVGSDWSFCAFGSGEVGAAVVDTVLPSQPCRILELPLSLRRPHKGSPLRATPLVDHHERQSALRRSVQYLAEHNFTL